MYSSKYSNNICIQIFIPLYEIKNIKDKQWHLQKIKEEE